MTIKVNKKPAHHPVPTPTAQKHTGIENGIFTKIIETQKAKIANMGKSLSPQEIQELKHVKAMCLANADLPGLSDLAQLIDSKLNPNR